ncbi:MAG: FtsX-like permease family protein [Yoonia sp.]|nr:FtsX-like permease family protein [Yoonia sp.]
MKYLLTLLFGRLPIGWLQLVHSKTRFAAAIAGVAFAALLVFMQLGIMGAMNQSTMAPYSFFKADIMISPQDSNMLSDGGNVARARLFQALSVSGVADGAALFIGRTDFTLEDGSTSSLQTFGIDTGKADFLSADIGNQIQGLQAENTALIDIDTNGVPPEVFAGLAAGHPFSFEVFGKTLAAVGTLKLGGSFFTDGTIFISDQTFLRIFPSRSSGAPNRILITVEDGISADVVAARLAAVLPAGSVKVQTIPETIAADRKYQNTVRPTGIIFGFGVLIGIIVGIVIVYQVLSTDVADHLSEYATFKAMGYSQSFFLGIVFEEALVLAVFGFIPGLIVSLGLYFGMSIATGLPIEMDLGRVVMVFFGTLAACAISGAIATRRLAGADPADLF